MAPAIPAAELRLSYPLYALDSDPNDANRLIVGGGGGAARSGVGNKISMLNAAQDDALQLVSELELSRDEDSINTLAVGARKGNSVLVYAGINSAEPELQKGKNEHFRVFEAGLPSKAKAEPRIAELSRTALFSTTDADAYQRLLRISGRVGAVATGTIGRPNDAQIAIFELPPAGSGSQTPKPRGKLELPKEAMDLDILQISEDEYQLVYCDDYDIYTLIIGKASTTGPYRIFTMPHDMATGRERPSIRCIRFLTPTFVLAVANLPKAGGVVLHGYRLPKTTDLGKEEKEGNARLAISAQLPKSVTRATGVAVRNLAPPATPSTRQPDTQFVIAVTGQDSSITLYTLDHQTVGDINLIANLYPVTTLKEVHLGPISGLAFSHFSPPPRPSSSSATTSQKPPAHLKLASIGSMANTCVVHTLPLKKLPAAASTTASKGPPRPARYVLALKSRAPSGTWFYIGSALIFALIAVLLQGALEIQGLSRPVVGARAVTPVSWHSPGRYYALTEAAPPVTPLPGGFLAAGGAYDSREDGKMPVLLHQEGEKEEIRLLEDGHDEDRHGPARVWEELLPAQKQAWKEKLKKAGHWGEEMGEAVLKGVLFGEIGGFVGAVAAQAL